MRRQSNKNKFGNILLSVFALSIIVLTISVYLYQSFQIDLIMKDLHGLHQKKKELLSETESLQAKVDRLSNVDRISSLARKEFNLEYSDERAKVIKLDDMDRLATIKSDFENTKSENKTLKAAGIQ